MMALYIYLSKKKKNDSTYSMGPLMIFDVPNKLPQN